MYVKHNYPNLFKNENGYEQFLPRIPGAEDNYGMMYHKPESEAEMTMHELWLARRQQEAFNWKSQQHMNLVMDRYALHKSRLESDSLRRQESNTFLRSRPGSSDDYRPHSAEGLPGLTARFTGRSRPSTKGSTAIPKSMSATNLGLTFAENSNIEADTGSLGADSVDEGEQCEIPLMLKEPEREIEAAVPVPARQGVKKVMKKKAKVGALAPMRYRFEPRKYETGSVYMQLSDSDDDDKPSREMPMSKPGTSAKGGKKGGGKAAAAPAVKFRREVPVLRERPVSANRFHAISQNDAELKVHYRHTNYRRMPLTATQEAWLEAKEQERAKRVRIWQPNCWRRLQRRVVRGRKAVTRRMTKAKVRVKAR